MFKANNINILLGLLLTSFVEVTEEKIPFLSSRNPTVQIWTCTFTKLIQFDHKSFQFNFIKVHVSARKPKHFVFILLKEKENILL